VDIFSKNTQICNFMKIRVVPYGRTDRQADEHDEVNSRFLAILPTRLKTTKNHRNTRYNPFFWDVTPCHRLSSSWCSERKHCLRVKEFVVCRRDLLVPASLWRWKQYVLSKRRELLGQRCGVTSQKNLFPSHKEVKTLKPAQHEMLYRGADKSLAQPGRKQANVSVRMVWICFGALPCKKKKIFDDSSRLDVVEITRVPDMLPNVFPSWSG